MAKILSIIKLCLDLGIIAVDMICTFIKVYRETLGNALHTSSILA